MFLSNSVFFGVVILATLLLLIVGVFVLLAIYSKVGKSKKFVTLKGYEVMFSTGHSRFVTIPEAFYGKGWDVNPVTAKIKAVDLYSSARGGLSSNVYEVVDATQSTTINLVTDAVIVANETRKNGFFKTFTTI